MSDDAFVRISAGCLVVYTDDDGEQVGTVRNVHPDKELVEVTGVPGVLRLRDITAVGVYGDEATFHLDPNGTGDERITTLGASGGD